MESIEQVKKLFGLVNRSVHWRLFVLLVVLIAGAVLEIVSVGAVFPLLQVMMEPHQLERVAYHVPALRGLTLPTFLVGGCVVIFAVFLVKTVIVMFGNWLKWRVQAHVYQTLSAAIFRSYLESPLSFHARIRATDLMRNVTTNVAQTTQYGFLSVIDFLGDALTCIGIFIVLAFVKPLISFLALTSIVLLAALYIKIGSPFFAQWGKRLSAASGSMYRFALEPLIGIKTIKVLGREAYFEAQFDRAVIEYSNTNSANGFQNVIPRQLLELIAVVSLVGIIIWTVMSGGNLAALISVLALFAAAVYRMTPAIVRMAIALQNFRVSRESIDIVYAGVMREKELKRSESVGPRIETFNRDIVLENATFTYEGAPRPAIDGVNLVVRRGETIAFVGSSGAGKTTLVDVILGLQKLASGTVAIDGIAYSSAAQIRLGIFGYVPQESFLIDDTIRRNIALGLPDDQIDNARVTKAIAMAAIEDVVAALPHGLDTVVGDRGMRLSGGQRQRVGIARALYHDPQVLILDEATSSIDMTTEAEISAAVSKLRGHKTVIVIAHRLSTVRECDRVLFFKNGRIVDEGRFDELVQMNDDFADMVRRMGADAPAPALDALGAVG